MLQEPDSEQGAFPIFRWTAYLCCFSFLILFLTACMPQNNTTMIEHLDGSKHAITEIEQEITELLEAGKVHGLLVAIFNENQAVYEQSFGYKNYEEQAPFNDTTNLYGASLSKAVFAVLVMKLVEEGVIDLDTPLESYLPKKIYEYEPQARWHDNYADLKADSLYHKITARMCLSHTTGFPNWRWFEEDQKLRTKFEPGSKYMYSGEGFVYLQVVIEKLMGKGLEAIAQEKLFGPLGMEHSAYEWKERFATDFAHGHNVKGKAYQKDTDNEPRGGSTLETSMPDYTHFSQVVLAQDYLSAASWKELFSPQIRLRSLRQFGPLSLQDSTLNDAIELSYGLGWGILKTPYSKGVFKEGHGDGFQHYSILFPEAGKGVILLTNSDNGEGIFKDLLALTIGDTYTPWEWQNYIPYDERE